MVLFINKQIETRRLQRGKVRFLRIDWSKVVASTMCAIALVIFFIFAPTPTHSQVVPEGCTCMYAGEEYSEGACRDGQRCNCVEGEGVWFDDENC